MKKQLLKTFPKKRKKSNNGKIKKRGLQGVPPETAQKNDFLKNKCENNSWSN